MADRSPMAALLLSSCVVVFWWATLQAATADTRSAASVVIIDGRRVDGETVHEEVLRQRRSLPLFDAVRIRDFPGTIEIVRGKVPEVMLTAGSTVLPKIGTVVRGKTLEIFARESYTTSVDLLLRVMAPVPLASIEYSGSGDLIAEGLTGPSLSISLSGAGSMRLHGSVRNLDLQLGGSGSMDLRGLEARDCRLMMQGAGDVRLTTLHSLRGTVQGAGSVVYFGHPKELDLQVGGAADVSAGD